jgi:hypothetical protein
MEYNSNSSSNGRYCASVGPLYSGEGSNRGYSGRCSHCGRSDLQDSHIGKYGNGGGSSSSGAGIPVISGGYS